MSGFDTYIASNNASVADVAQQLADVSTDYKDNKINLVEYNELVETITDDFSSVVRITQDLALRQELADVLSDLSSIVNTIRSL